MTRSLFGLHFQKDAFMKGFGYLYDELQVMLHFFLME